MNIEKVHIEAISLLKNLISTPSFSKNEYETAGILEKFLLDKGLKYKRKVNNIWVECMDKPGKPTILLNSHHDTVKPVAGWNRDPFQPIEEGARIFGLGSNDAGGSLVSLLQAFLILKDNPREYNLVFLASAEEEISGKNGVEAVIKDLPAIDLAIVGEPTDMQPAIAEKGLIVVDATVYGKSGHAARTEGENAIYSALNEIEVLKNMDLPRKSKWLGNVKLTVTQVNAGTQHNVIPDRCEFVIDIRTTDQYSNHEIMEILENKLSAELKPRSLRLNSSGIGENHTIIQKSIKMGLKPFGSPTLSDQALMPFDSIKIGPGDSSRSHTADEFIYSKEIKSGIETYYKLLKGLKI